MREICQSGSEGGVALTRHPYPYHGWALWRKWASCLNRGVLQMP